MVAFGVREALGADQIYWAETEDGKRQFRQYMSDYEVYPAIIVDDINRSGKAIQETIDLVKEVGSKVIGIGTIGRMGATYWHAMVIYTVLALAQWTIGYGLDRIPIAGALVRSFVYAYAWLAIACTLGLAVFKKADVLGWD